MMERSKGPCPKCSSSDAFHLYPDGGYCFSCGYKEKNLREDIVTKQFIPWRGISKGTMEFYNVAATVTSSGDPLAFVFPYPNGRSLERYLPKQFKFLGEKIREGNLFGQDRFPAGSAKAITITEGAVDALSVYEMLGGYPSIAITSASTGKAECASEYEYLNSFDKIYICFDSDPPGQKAAREVARLFDFNKVYVVNLLEKDANEYLQKGKTTEFKKTWWAARRFMPEGILSSYTEFERVIDEDEFKPSVPYPFETLEEKTYGIRKGEFNLLSALEGIGKTEIIRAIEYHLLKTTDDNIGIIHLEESKARSIKGLVGYSLRQPIHLPDRRIPNNEIKKAFKGITRRDDRLHLYSHFGSDDPDTILSTIRFLAGACNCRYVFLDHITMVVTGLLGDDERRALDYISTRLAMMVEELDFTLFCISHENDDGQTRGSRNISKVSDLWIQLKRNIQAETEEERNTTRLMIKKNRFSGRTGYAGSLIFNPETFILEEKMELPQ